MLKPLREQEWCAAVHFSQKRPVSSKWGQNDETMITHWDVPNWNGRQDPYIFTAWNPNDSEQSKMETMKTKLKKNFIVSTYEVDFVENHPG